MKTLIVESPTKAKTIGKYLGKGFQVIASYGHVRDLLSKNGSVDPEKNFKMTWTIADKSKKQIDKIEELVRKSDTVLLATDPDREGEAIAWHICEILKNDLKSKKVGRIVFHEITKKAIEKSLEEPRDINQSLVNAYLARRSLDYLFGFTLSPVLWRKLPGARSAGRVQSVALRLIVEREKEIDDFIIEEYWSIEGIFDKHIESSLIQFDNQKLEKFSITKQEEAQKVVDTLKPLAYKVAKVENKKISRTPPSPYATSSLQQDSFNKCGFSASKTMRVAQQLYEGIKIDSEQIGLITYMRTDNTSLSKDAVDSVRKHIKTHYKKDYLPSTPREFKNKVKNAQEAHEAIRPTQPDLTPESIRHYLDDDQFKLYNLIWKRTIASQMANAEFNQLRIDIGSDGHVFRGTGQICLFDGFLTLYEMEKNKTLPDVKVGQELKLTEITPNQHFTQPPPRYNEASLISKLEELGIGRPSTYAPMIETLKDRKYVYLDKKRLVPELVGRFVIEFLKEYFPQYVKYEFTADMETFLDEISSNKEDWHHVLKTFWDKFSQTVEGTSNLTITDVINKLEEKLTNLLFKHAPDRVCPKCKTGELHLKLSKYGAFLGCSRYPECDYVQDILGGESKETTESSQKPAIMIGEFDGITAYLRYGPYGPYLQFTHPKKKKPTNVSVSIFENPENVTLEQAKFLYKLPYCIGQYEGIDAFIDVGRFGPYIKYNEKNVGIPKDIDFFHITLDEVQKILAEKKNAPVKKRAGPAKKTPTRRKKA